MKGKRLILCLKEKESLKFIKMSSSAESDLNLTGIDTCKVAWIRQSTIRPSKFKVKY